MNKAGQIIKITAEIAGVGAAINYGMEMSQIPQLLKDFAGYSFELVSNLPIGDAARHAAFGASLLFVVATRVGDYVGDKIVKPTTWKGQIAKQFISATVTVLTGAVTGAFIAAGPVTVPAVVSVAALAAIVWTLTKVADAAFAVLKALAMKIMNCRQNEKNFDYENYIHTNKPPMLLQDSKQTNFKLTPPPQPKVQTSNAKNTNMSPETATEMANKDNAVLTVDQVNNLVVFAKSPNSQELMMMNIDVKNEKLHKIGQHTFLFKPAAIKLLQEKIDIVEERLFNVNNRIEQNNKNPKLSNQEKIDYNNVNTVLQIEQEKLTQVNNHLYDLLADWKLLMTEEKVNELLNNKQEFVTEKLELINLLSANKKTTIEYYKIEKENFDIANTTITASFKKETKDINLKGLKEVYENTQKNTIESEKKDQEKINELNKTGLKYLFL